MKTYTKEQFVKWGEQGPKKRKRNRVLTREQSLAMLKARRKKRRKATRFRIGKGEE